MQEGSIDWKRFVVATRYFAMLPMRHWANARARRLGTAPVMVLFYHRVADSHPNDWTMSHLCFARQMDWLCKHVDVVSLSEAQRRIRDGHNQRPAVAVTFDDGYAENCEFALPLMIQRRIPCTYFVSLQHVTCNQPFPHDVASGTPLPPNTIEDLRWMSQQGIEIGAHTRTHADLGKVTDMDCLHDELVVSRQELEQIIGQEVPFFAFPYGQHANLSSEAFQVAHEAEYRGVCSAYGGYNFPGEDPFHLQRIHADPEMIRFLNWMSVDPRKPSVVSRYDYTIDQSSMSEAADVASVS